MDKLDLIEKEKQPINSQYIKHPKMRIKTNKTVTLESIHQLTYKKSFYNESSLNTMDRSGL